MTETTLTQALFRHFDWQKNDCHPNLMLFPWESDLLVLSPAKFVTEVEVKVSISDWKSDSKKQKFVGTQRATFDRYIKKFYYAVPEELVAKAPEIPAFAGILAFDGHSYKIIKEAETRKALGLSHGLLSRIERSTYYRFSRQFLSKSFAMGTEQCTN